MSILDSVLKESNELIGKLGFADKSMIGTNFRSHGGEMGIYDYEDYKRYAKRIFDEAMKNPGGFTIMELPKKQKAIDFHCFKFISDNADGDAAHDWSQQLAIGAALFAGEILHQ